MPQKVALVTGANKGIGYAIVKALCEKFDGKVYLTARDESRGKEAVNKLKEQGFNPVFHQLDICNQDSINKLRDYIKETEGGIDILVNNAAIAYGFESTVSATIIAEETVTTNYYGTLQICKAIFPLLRENAQVVNVSSSLGHLSYISSVDLKSKFAKPNITVDKLNQLMDQYVSDVKRNMEIEKRWHKYAYTISKIGVTVLTTIQQREFNAETEKRNVSVNSVHPGYADTDMTNHKGHLTVEEAALAPLFLALGEHKLKGQFVWRDCTVVDWTAPAPPALY